MTKYSLFLYKKVRFIPHLSCHAHPSDDTIAKRVDQQRTVTADIVQQVYPNILIYSCNRFIVSRVSILGG